MLISNWRTRPKTSRRRAKLEKLDQLILWDRLVAPLEGCYPKRGRGRPPWPLETMLRIHILQCMDNRSDPGMEEELLESSSYRRFCRLCCGHVPDETTILRFRHWLEDCHLGQAIFGKTVDIRRGRGVLMKQGTSVDSTLIDAPPSTRNRAKERDPEMHSTRKGKNWRFGMKAHIGVDRDSGAVHSLAVTSANGSDVAHAPSVLHGEEQEVLGDAGYQGIAEREEHRDREVSWKIGMRPGKRRKLPKDSAEASAEKEKSPARVSVEDPFHFLKCQFEYRKVRYRGLRKNHNRLLVLFALANQHSEPGEQVPMREMGERCAWKAGGLRTARPKDASNGLESATTGTFSTLDCEMS